MSSVPTIKGPRVTLRKAKEEDIEDRLAIGRHHEFVHMCGGNTLAAPEYPGREIWEAWYNSCKDIPYSWVIEVQGRCIGTAGFHHISEQDRSATYRIGIFDVACHRKRYRHGNHRSAAAIRFYRDEMASY